MKKIFVASVALLIAVSAWAQKDSTSQSGYQFSVVKQNPITSIKNQGSSGTCWSFSGVGFLESELLKMGKATLICQKCILYAATTKTKP